MVHHEVDVTAGEHGACRRDALACLCINRTVADWCHRQLRILQDGADDQVDLAAAALPCRQV
jgi:hypothetical protein